MSKHFVTPQHSNAPGVVTDLGSLSSLSWVLGLLGVILAETKQWLSQVVVILNKTSVQNLSSTTLNRAAGLRPHDQSHVTLEEK